MSALFQIDLGISDEYDALIKDLLKVAVAAIVFHLLSEYSGKGPTKLFSEDVLVNIIHILLGVSAYHLVGKKLISLT